MKKIVGAVWELPANPARQLPDGYQDFFHISNTMSFEFCRHETVETHALEFLTHIISAIGIVFALLLFTLG